jgi:hypothetical protein
MSANGIHVPRLERQTWFLYAVIWFVQLNGRMVSKVRTERDDVGSFEGLSGGILLEGLKGNIQYYS